MDSSSEKAFELAPLGSYTLRQRAVIRLADLGFYALISLIGRTLRFETENEERLGEARSMGRPPILAFWHNRIFAGTFYFRGQRIVVMTSQSFDGEYIARFIQRLGYGAARGSSTRGGVGALIEMIRLVGKGFSAAFTVDGPKGPRYEAKVGPCLLAKKTGAPIVPFVAETKSYWEVGSWDRLQIPKPFSKVKIFFGPHITVDGAATDSEVEASRIQLQSELDRLVEKGRRWRTGSHLAE